MITENYQLELRQFRYFLAVADHLHFRKAAEQLYISQPGLSKQIRKLEEVLGVALFKRHNRKVELTRAGLYLQTELRLLLQNMDSVIMHTRLMEDGKEGNLRFGYVGSAMQEAIPKILLEIRKTYPKILFDLKELDNQIQIESLFKQEIDIGFVRMERVPRGLVMEPILEDTFSLVLPTEHPINQDTFQGLEQFQEEKFILFKPSYSNSYYEKIMQLFDESGFMPNISHNTVHASTIYRLVENNFGVSIVPTSLQIGYDMAVKFIELRNSKQRTTLNMVWNASNRNPILKNVLDLIIA